MKNFLLGLVMSMLIFACKEESPICGDPMPTNCELILTDTLNNYLVGTKYNQDSIQLLVNNELIPLTFFQGEIIFNFSGYENFNASTYILKLNKNDFDTLKIRISKYSNECFTGYSLDTLRYNKQIMQNSSVNKYKIIK